MKKYYNIFFLGCLATVLFSGCGKNDEPDIVPEDNDVNEWIYKMMDQHYLWYNELPSKSSLNFAATPEEFFISLLSDNDGKMRNGKHLPFSYIEKTPEKTKTISEYEPTYGFEFMAYGLSGTDRYWVQVLYVVNGSPADKAGIKRGEWITSTGVNKAPITDYHIMESGGAITFNMAKYNTAANDLIATRSVEVEAAVVMDNNPFVKDTVLYAGGKTIGYLAYTHFTSGPNGYSDKAWDNQMKEIFAQFKTKQVNEFVLDLRYNGGGLVSSAQLLSSLLAPSSALGKVFGYMNYNDKQSSGNSTLYFDKTSAVSSANLNLNRLYILVGEWTASASEAVINMLIPYMGRGNITLIGMQTIGKNVGSNTFGDDEDTKYGWLLHPITLRIYNSEHNADYDDGFAPDIELDEITFGNVLYPLGTPEELLMKAALSRISGNSLRQQTLQPTTTRLQPVYNSLERRGVKELIVDMNN